jgi:superfamily II DNA/RNA helicase
VLDEADRIVETGHFPEVEKIIDFIQRKNEKQDNSVSSNNDSNQEENEEETRYSSI